MNLTSTLVWSHIKEPILEYMTLMRQSRLQRELNALILIRKGVAIEVLRALKKARFLEGNQVMPEPPDFCDFEPVKEIINRPADVDLVSSTFDPILPLLPGIISSWRNKMDGAMADVVKRFIFLKGQPGPGKLLKGGVRKFGYLRPQNRQICVHKFDYLRLLGAGFCPKIWLFQGKLLPKVNKNSAHRTLIKYDR